MIKRNIKRLKRQAIGWDKIFKINSLTKSLHLEYIKIAKKNTEKSNFEKLSKDLNRNVTKRKSK